MNARSGEAATGRAITVLGPVPAADLGVTLVHEHVLMSLLVYWRAPAPDDAEAQAFATQPVSLENLWWVRQHIMDNRDNCQLDNLEHAIHEVRRFKAAGGGTLTEVTSANIGRDVRGLAEVSRRTNVHVIAGTGYYIAPSHPPELADRSVASLTEEMTRDLLEGIGETGVRAGVIGEIGTSDPITDVEERVVRAAAQAQRRTGAPIVVHPAPGKHSVRRLATLLEGCGADPTRVVISHLDERMRDDVPSLLALARRGFVLGYDTFGREAYYASRDTQLPSDADRIQVLMRLLEAGYAGSVGLAQDICFKTELTAYGGHGYAHLLRHIVPRLRLAGVTPSDLDTMLITTPRRLLAWA